MASTGKGPPTVATLLDARSRGEIKRWGAFLDEAELAFREDLVTAARARGAIIPDEALEYEGKHLLRACLDRTGAAQVRTNPIVLDEAFSCFNCSFAVPLGGRRPRDHCPRCLFSRHVDVVPGDRAANCDGALVPVGAEQTGKGWMILYCCEQCGMTRRNRFLDDVSDPDSQAVLRVLVARVSPDGAR